MNGSRDDEARTLYAESAHYVIRTLEVADATESWCDWLMDPRAQINLNAAPQRLVLDQVRTYVASFDRKRSHIVGIFAKDTGQLVGIRNAYVDREHRECTLNTLIGETQARGRGANHESRYAMHNFVLEDLDLDCARATVVGENEYMFNLLTRTGWVHEHTSTKPRASGEGLVQLRHMRLTRDAWRAGEAAKAKALSEGKGG